MTITYEQPAMSTSVQSRALQNFKAVYEDFEQDGTNVLSEGIVDVLNNRVAFSEFTERLLEGTNTEEHANMLQLAENVRMSMLTESMTSGTNPVTALSLPMLRVGWPKIAVREGLPTEAVEQPKFKVTTKRPYVRAKDGSKHYLPAALVGPEAVDFSLPRLKGDEIEVTGGSLSNHDLLAPISKSHVEGDEIDPVFSVTKVWLDFEGTKVEKDVNFKLDTNINVATGTVKNDDGSKEATVLVTVNRELGLMNATAVGATLEKISVAGFVTSEANNSATQIGMDITAEEMVIGTAQPLEAPINIQHMTDVMAMYQIDATLNHIETMTTFLAHTTDREGVNFIDETFDRLSKKITEKFDVVAPSNYALGDVEWREQLKAKLDRLVSRMQTSVNIYSGHTVIFCHPLDAQIISNVKWVYTATEQVNDVAVTYRVGNYVSGTTSYVVLQSPYFSQGSLRVVYIPSEAEHKSLVYYPYSFTTIRGSASSSPNSVNVPAIQMIKRHLFKAFTPLVAKLTIENNGV